MAISLKKHRTLGGHRVKNVNIKRHVVSYLYALSDERSRSEKVVFARGGGRLKIFVLLRIRHAFPTTGIPTNACICLHKYTQTCQLHLQAEVMKVLEPGGSLAVSQG